MKLGGGGLRDGDDGSEWGRSLGDFQIETTLGTLHVRLWMSHPAL
jgi:hypothetical protein